MEMSTKKVPNGQFMERIEREKKNKQAHKKRSPPKIDLGWRLSLFRL